MSWGDLEAYRLEMTLCHAHMCVSWRLAREIVADENRLVKFRKPNSHKPRRGLQEKTLLLCEKFAMRSLVCEHVWNKSIGSSLVEASVYMPEAISWKMFQRLTKGGNSMWNIVGTLHGSKKVYQYQFWFLGNTTKHTHKATTTNCEEEIAVSGNVPISFTFIYWIGGEGGEKYKEINQGLVWRPNHHHPTPSLFWGNMTAYVK